MLRVFDNTVLKRIFGRKRDEVTGDWRRLYYKELYVMYFSGYQIKKTETDRACSTYGGEERCIQGFDAKTLGKETIWNTQA
jgi:hypothetical protein